MLSFFSKNKIRARFAPSPTGYLHIGGLRTALYNYLLAKQQKGDFILRIEDTDQAREVPGAVENLLKTLKWAGLEPDEGVILDSSGKVSEKGRFGPYTQSKRLPVYRKYAQKLLDEGYAYPCFCSPERLENLRKMQAAAQKPTRYDWHCRHLTEVEIKEKKENGEKPAIRLKVPENQELEFTDWVRGKIKIETKEIDDQIILKSNGFPTYHLASVVDDHLMQISHVIRGEEWLPSTPKHILLYLFLNWETPQFIHLPLILNPDKTKLAKRQGDAAAEDYQKDGYLPEALVNFISLLGWNPGTEQEIFSLAELINVFDLTKVHKAGAVFNQDKLAWLNREYIKKLPLAKFQELARPRLKEKYPQADLTPKIFALEQQRISKLSEIGEGLRFVFQELPYDPSLLIWKNTERGKIRENLRLILAELTQYAGEWKTEALEKHLLGFIKEKNLANGETLWPMRAALTGLDKSPSPFEAADVLGKERVLERLRKAIDLL